MVKLCVMPYFRVSEGKKTNKHKKTHLLDTNTRSKCSILLYNAMFSGLSVRAAVLKDKRALKV